MAEAQIKSYIRSKDLSYLVQCIQDNDCCSVVGVSNIGKSNLLRHIQQSGIVSNFSTQLTDQDIGFIYVDFNLQLQMTEQGFYELLLRTTLNQLKNLQVEQHIIEQIENAYQQIITSSNEFQNALNFNQAIINLCENWSRHLVFLFDEFDEIFNQLEARVFLNLRAIRDKYPKRLLYIVVTDKPLLEVRKNVEASEFAELFAHHVYYLKPLEFVDIKQFINSFVLQNKCNFSEKDSEFIMTQSGGHPGLLEIVCRVMAKDTLDGVATNTQVVLSHLDNNKNIREECVKLWKELSITHKKALLKYIKENKIPPNTERELVQLGLLIKSGDNKISVFGKLFKNFVHRQQLVYEKALPPVFLDVDSGQVYIGGKPTKALSQLEYRLLLLLYGHIDQICSRHKIVEAVWGEDYIPKIDNMRIDKLIARLRQKIESDPNNPKYLHTVKGRGYRLKSFY